MKAFEEWLEDEYPKGPMLNYHETVGKQIERYMLEAFKAGWRAKSGKPANGWKCPINYPGCKENCGSYGCGN